MIRELLIVLVLMVGWSGVLSAGSPCRIGANGKSNCPVDTSSADDGWIIDPVWGDVMGTVCDASPDLCQDGDPDTDTGDYDPCGTCTTQPIGDPIELGTGCLYPAQLVCPDPDCDLDGKTVWVDELVCSQWHIEHSVKW